MAKKRQNNLQENCQDLPSLKNEHFCHRPETRGTFLFTKEGPLLIWHENVAGGFFLQIGSYLRLKILDGN